MLSPLAHLIAGEHALHTQSISSHSRHLGSGSHFGKHPHDVALKCSPIGQTIAGQNEIASLDDCAAPSELPGAPHATTRGDNANPANTAERTNLVI
jgi:hypothetical protein